MYYYCIGLLFLLLFFEVPTSHSAELLHWIPLANGSFVQYSDEQVREFVDRSARFFSYNPRKHVNFYLHYRPLSWMKEKQKIVIGDVESLEKSKFNSSWETKIIVHGWNAAPEEDSIEWIANAFLDHPNYYNVIEVDWRKGSNTFNYIAAKMRDNPTGKIVAEFVDFLVSKGGANLADFELIGFSLGAHIVGFAGKYLNAQVPVIVGLEPAGPLYSLADVKGRLDKSDAKFVEVVHTNAGTLGFEKPIGDVDFYANGGKRQNGCGVDWNGGCSHARAWLYYSEAIYSEIGFWGRKCLNYESIKSSGCKKKEEPRRLFVERPMNESSLVKGVYWFLTNKQGPYAKGYH